MRCDYCKQLYYGWGENPALHACVQCGSPDVSAVMLNWQRSGTYETTCCVFAETCDGVRCGPGKVCKMKTGRPQCVCSPDCSHISRRHAVCGSDGKTYKDECSMLMARCMGHPDLEVMYQGECKSKELTCTVVKGSLTVREANKGALFMFS